jgi:hypothetical protein
MSRLERRLMGQLPLGGVEQGGSLTRGQRVEVIGSFVGEPDRVASPGLSVGSHDGRLPFRESEAIVSPPPDRAGPVESGRFGGGQGVRPGLALPWVGRDHCRPGHLGPQSSTPATAGGHLGPKPAILRAMQADPVVRVLAALDAEALRRKFGLQDD